MTLPVVKADCEYLEEARAGDILDHGVVVTPGRRWSVTTVHDFRRGDGRLLARGSTVRANTDLSAMESVPQSEELRLALGSE